MKSFTKYVLIFATIAPVFCVSAYQAPLFDANKHARISATYALLPCAADAYRVYRAFQMKNTQEDAPSLIKWGLLSIALSSYKVFDITKTLDELEKFKNQPSPFGGQNATIIQESCGYKMTIQKTKQLTLHTGLGAEPLYYEIQNVDDLCRWHKIRRLLAIGNLGMGIVCVSTGIYLLAHAGTKLVETATY